MQRLGKVLEELILRTSARRGEKGFDDTTWICSREVRWIAVEMVFLP